MERKDRIDAIGGAALIGFSLLMGLNQALIKLVNAGLAPAFQAGLRSALALPLVLLFALAARRRLSVADGSLWPGIACGLFFSGEFLLLFLALEYTAVSRASVLFYTMPVWVALGAHFLIPGERMSLRRLIGLTLAVGGVALALLGRGPSAGPAALIGDLMCLGGAACWAGIALVARTTRLQHSDPEMQLVYQLAVSSVVLLAAAPLFGETIREMTPAIAGIFAFQVVFVVSIGFLVFFWVLRHYPASDMAAFTFLAPLFGVLAGWIVLDEPISPAIVGALALVGAGIVLVNWKPRPRTAPAA
jgi:drug/metabolite transporter (DMT)-like permease